LGEKYLIAFRFAAINLSGIEIRDSFDIVPLPAGGFRSLSSYINEIAVAICALHRGRARAPRFWQATNR
jgi:hypothetical protein